MNKIFPIILAVFVSLPVLSLDAQDVTLPIPPPQPLIKRAPDFSSWTLSFTPKPGTANAPTSVGKAVTLKEIAIKKTKDIFFETITSSDGKTIERWVSHGNIMSVEDGSSEINVTDAYHANHRPTPVNFSTSDFPELEWVSIGDFKEITKYSGHLCYLYQRTSPANNLATFQSVKAWIDGTTGLPVAMEGKDILAVFTFKSLPEQELELPASFATALEAYLKIIRQTKGQ